MVHAYLHDFGHVMDGTRFFLNGYGSSIWMFRIRTRFIDDIKIKNISNRYFKNPISTILTRERGITFRCVMLLSFLLAFNSTVKCSNLIQTLDVKKTKLLIASENL